MKQMQELLRTIGIMYAWAVTQLTVQMIHNTCRLKHSKSVHTTPKIANNNFELLNIINIGTVLGLGGPKFS